jgi:hypothetical protein
MARFQGLTAKGHAVMSAGSGGNILSRASMGVVRAQGLPAVANPRLLKIQKYLPIAVVYFFLNSAGLPTGLFYTTMLAPIFFLWLYRHKQRWITAKFLVCLSPFLLAHAINGIDSSFYYVRSGVLLWTVCITVYAFCVVLLTCEGLERLFEQLIELNFCATLIALAVFFTKFRELLWGDSDIEGVGDVYRLKLLTSEPSVYSLLMLPLLVFAVLRLLQNPTKRNLLYVVFIGIPFLLCQSFGGLSISFAAMGIPVLIAFRNRLFEKRTLLILLAIVSLVALLVYVPNPISDRLSIVAAGEDSSTDSRTFSSFIVAYMVALPRSLWWGAGLGQAKLSDVSDLGLAFTVGIIPNAIAGAFAELGIVGIVFKFAMEFYLFFRTRVYRNSFRLAMFVAVFLIQLSGSYLMNVQEYLIWALAFGPFFPELDFKSKLTYATLAPDCCSRADG